MSVPVWLAMKKAVYTPFKIPNAPIHLNHLFDTVFFPIASATEAPREEPVPTSKKPNFIVIYLDDAGYGDFGCFGHPTIRTPNIDRMASEGMKLTQFYSPSPACSASRYSLLTGRYASRSRMPWVIMPGSVEGMHDDEINLAGALKSQGYQTACIGKWHVGHQPYQLPLKRGFDEYFGIPYSNDMRKPAYPPLPLIDGEKIIETEPDQTQFTRRFTEKAIDYLTRNRDHNFFLYLAHPMPHVPLYASEAFKGKSKRGLYGDVIEEIDWSVGEILKTLKAQNLDENTLVILTSDNGPWIIKNENGGSSGLLRDGKGNTWEGGVRVPCIARWPGQIPPQSVCQATLSTIDVFPTLVGLAGGEVPKEVPKDRTIDGLDMREFLLGKKQELERTIYLFGPQNKLHALRQGPWKFHAITASQTKAKHFEGRVPLLFNLDRDPSEEYDLSQKESEIVSKLSSQFEAFERDAR